MAVRQLMREGRDSQEVPVRLSHFKALLDTPTMAPMFEPGRPFGTTTTAAAAAATAAPAATPLPFLPPRLLLLETVSMVSPQPPLTHT